MSDIKKVKFKIKGHGSFYLREGWLNKGISSLENNDRVFYDENIIDILGVGANMVPAIRYWIQATGLFDERIGERSQRIYELTSFGQRLLDDDNDKYFEDIFSWWLMHYNIVKNKELCTSWNLFFNKIKASELDRDEMYDVIEFELKEYIGEKIFSERSLRDDCNCIIKTYYEEDSEKKNPEDKTICPLSELGLIKKQKDRGKELIIKSSPDINKLDMLVVLYIIVDNCIDGRISIKDILEKENNAGKVLNLNRNILNFYLDKLKNNDYIIVNRTSGIDMVYLKDKYKDIDKLDIINEYFRR